MRIVCTVTNDLAQDQRMDRICASLQAAGHQVTLVGRELPDSNPLAERTYAQYRIHCRFTTGKSFYAEYNYRLWRELRKWNYDAICSVDLDTLLAGYWLTRATDRRWVYDAHEWFSETPEVYNRPLVRSAWRRLGRWLVPKTDARYTVAPRLALELKRDYGCDFGVVRNVPHRSILVTEQRDGPKDRKWGVILYQGMLNPGRGLETVIEAMAYLPECKLWIVGDGPERGRLKDLTAMLGLHQQIWFTGFQPYHELPAITRRAWLGLNLLDASASPSYYYSLANKALDYLQAGLPSVQMDLPEYRAIAEEFGCYVLLDRLDPALLAGRIQALVTDPATYNKLRDNCLAAAEALNWEREEDRLLTIWRGIDHQSKTYSE